MLQEALKKKASELGLIIGFTSKEQYEETKPLRDYLQFTESIISVLMPITKKDNQIMASFALERDYHHVLREKMDVLMEVLADYENTSYVDNGPIDDRLVALLSGQGFLGKHQLVISPIGTYHVLGEILTSAKLEADSPVDKDCGTCTKCIVACPTNCLPDNIYEGCLVGLLQQKRSYPFDIYEKFETIYGCDICQSVCPFNHGTPTKETYTYMNLDIHALLRTTKSTFKMFEDTAFYWLGHNVMKRNAIIYAANNGIDILEDLTYVQSKEEYMIDAINYYMKRRSL